MFYTRVNIIMFGKIPSEDCQNKYLPHMTWIDTALPEFEHIHIPCAYRACDTNYPTIFSRLYTVPNPEDRSILIWLTGGQGSRKVPTEIAGLQGRRRILVPGMPYELPTYDSEGRLMPEAFDGDSPARILSVLHWARDMGLRVVLGGHSNGVVRAVGCMSRYPQSHSLIQGLVMASSHTGTPTHRLPLTGAWHTPCLILHHRLDYSYCGAPKHHEWLHHAMSCINSASVTRHTVTSTRTLHTVDTDGTSDSTHHMFQDSGQEVADQIDAFMQQCESNGCA